MDPRMTYPNYGRYWANADVETAYEFLKEGLTREKLSKLSVALGRNPKAIIDKLSKSGFIETRSDSYAVRGTQCGISVSALTNLDRIPYAEMQKRIEGEPPAAAPVKAPDDRILYTRSVEKEPGKPVAVYASFDYLKAAEQEGAITKEIVDLDATAQQLWSALGCADRAVLLEAFKAGKLKLFVAE